MEADTGSPEGVLRRSGDCGMVLFTASASPESIGSDVKSTHETFWRRKVLMLMEPQEREDAFFRYENNEMVRLGGYYLYYEKIPVCRRI